MWRSIYKYFILAAVASAWVSAAGCGKSSDPNLVYPNGIAPIPIANPIVSSCGVPSPTLNTCLSGYVRTAGGTCMSQYGYGYYGTNSDFSSRCSVSGGVPINGSICQFSRDLVLVSTKAILNPGTPCGGFNAYMIVKPGDRLTITNATGDWGTTSISRDQFGPLWVEHSDSDCDQFSETGLDTINNQQITNGGLPAGIVASDGVNVFAVGTGITNFPIAADGMLRIGFNIPPELQLKGVCSSGIRLSAVLKHCEDTAGNTVVCP